MSVMDERMLVGGRAYTTLLVLTYEIPKRSFEMVVHPYCMHEQLLRQVAATDLRSSLMQGLLTKRFSRQLKICLQRGRGPKPLRPGFGG